MLVQALARFLSDLRDFQRLNVPFCYLCSEDLCPPTNKQHVVPRKIFHEDDRQPLLSLQTHKRCNAEESERDELAKDLIGVLWRPPEDAERHGKRLKRFVLPEPHVPSGSSVPGAVLDSYPLWETVFSWVRGFHAALYRECLPDTTYRRISGPMPGSEDLDDKLGVEPWHLDAVSTLKQSKLAGRLDGLQMAGGHFRYWCTWSRDKFAVPGGLKRRPPICIFGVDAYGWSRLADEIVGQRLGCVGYYESEVPEGASMAPTVRIPCANVHRLDPFSS